MAMSFRTADGGSFFMLSVGRPRHRLRLRAVNDPSQAGLIDLRIEVGIRERTTRR